MKTDPNLEDHELVRLIDKLDHLAAEVAALLLRGFAVAPGARSPHRPPTSA